MLPLLDYFFKLVSKKSLIKSVFSDNPQREFSTSEVVSLIEKEMEKIEKIICDTFTTAEKKKRLKNKKAKLHRKALYYLNSLCEEGFIILTKTSSKGEKYFKLLQEQSSVVKQFQSEKLEVKNTLARLGTLNRAKDPWVNKLDSLLIECSKVSALQLKKIVLRVSKLVKDVIGLNEFESFLIKHSPFQAQKCLREIEQTLSSRNSDMRINLIFKLEKAKKEHLKNFFEQFEKKEGFDLIFEGTPQQINNFQDIIKSVLVKFNRLYFKNSLTLNSPLMIGTYGPYSFNDEEWSFYKRSNDKLIVIPNSGQSVGLDCQSLTRKDFVDHLKTGAKTLFQGNFSQRKRYDSFNDLALINNSEMGEVFCLFNNYVRIWNYGFKAEQEDGFLEKVEEAKSFLTNFSSSEETVYKSCGMPIRFKIRLSCLTEEEAKKNNFSQKNFGDFHISNISNQRFSLKHNSSLRYFKEKEKLFSLLHTDFLLIHAPPEIEIERGIKDIIYLLENFYFKFFCYQLNSLKKDKTLKEFLE